jgi:hypothetical protein
MMGRVRDNFRQVHSTSGGSCGTAAPGCASSSHSRGRLCHTFFVISIVALNSLAQSPQISLPLEGYYRVGQYMPVRVAGESGEVVLSASGAVPTRIAGTPSVQEAVAPLLLMTSGAAEITATMNGQVVKSGPLRALAPDERLVGVTEGNEAFAASLFPGKKVITVPIDPQFPNPAAAPTWDALDAVVLDASAQTILAAPENVLANGTIIAIKTAQAPQGDWEWEQRGEYWVLNKPVYGPTGAEIDLDDYAPSYGSEPEEGLPVRQLVVIGGALFALLVVGGTLLLRPRAGLIVTALLSIATAAIAIVATMHATAAEVSRGTVEIFSSPAEQTDTWRYLRSWRQPAGCSESAFTLIYPMLASASEIERFHLELQCRSNGAAEKFDLTLPPHYTIAWMDRTMRGNMPRPQLSPSTLTPFTQIVNDKYLSPSAKELGRDRDSDAIVLEPK